MKELLGLLKEGNKSALTAVLVNTVVSIIKGITYFLQEISPCSRKRYIVLEMQQINFCFHRLCFK